MREIKFRAWDKIDKKMKRVFAFDFGEWWVATNFYGGEKGVCDGERNSFRNEETDRHILMQYTGLKDKNGKEIYEGDILRVPYYPNQDRVVEWGDGRLIYKRIRREIGDWYSYESLIVCQKSTADLKVVGNIHDNPELLEVQHD